MPKQDNNISVDRFKAEKRYKFVIASLIIVIIFLIVYIVATPKEESFSEPSLSTEKVEMETTEKEMAETESSEEISEQSETIQFSDNIEDFTFELEGAVYSLPVSCKMFQKNGWRFELFDSDHQNLPAGEIAQGYIKKGDASVNVSIINNTLLPQPLEACNVCKIEVLKTDPVDIKIAKGITNNSTKEEITKAYGLMEYEWSEMAGNDYFSFSCYKDYLTGRIMSYEFAGHDEENCYDPQLGALVVSLEITRSETSDEDNSICFEADINTNPNRNVIAQGIPEYLSEYKLPEKMSDNPEDPVFILDGKVYGLPCTAKAFTENGWEIEEKYTSYVYGGESVYHAMALTKDNNRITVGVENKDEYARRVEACSIYRLSVDAYQLKGKYKDTFFQLPGGVNISTTYQEIEEKFKYLKNDGDDDDYKRYVYSGNSGTSVSIEYLWYDNQKEPMPYYNLCFIP